MNFQGAPDQVLTIPTARHPQMGAGFAATEPVIGYRAWLVEPDGDGYRLSGVLSGQPWATIPEAWTRAECTLHADPSLVPAVRHDQLSVPELACTCGLYAYHSLSIGGYDERVRVPESGDLSLVWGAAAGAGRVLVYDDGWRAQFARPVALLRGSGSERHVRGAAARLGIPVVPASDIARVGAEFGRPRKTLASPTLVSLEV